MHRLAFALILSTTFASAQKQWTVEDIYKEGGPTGQPPHSIEWSPDGRILTLIAADDKVGHAGDLLQLDAATGKLSVLATKEKLASSLSALTLNEKDKDHRARYGMPSYTWAADNKHLILDSGGTVFLYDIASGKAQQIVDTGNGSGDDPKFSPDAKSISYLRGHNLYVHPLSSSKEIALTEIPKDTPPDSLLNGEVDWVYLEELEVRTNYAWSPDSKRIAYLQADESKVPEYPLPDLNETHATVDMQRYPQPGDPNPSVRIGIVSATGGKTKWIDLPFSPGNDYIPRFNWLSEKTLYIETLTRDHQHLTLYFVDANTGRSRAVFTDTDSKYLDTNYDLTLVGNNEFLFKSWRDGHTHLYLYSFNPDHPLDADATLVRQITNGVFEVEQLLSVDEKTHTVYYIANEESPTENALWSIQLDGTHKQLLTPTPQFAGTQIVALAPDFKHFVDLNGGTLSPPTLSLCDLRQACTPIWQPRTLVSLGYTPIHPQTLRLKAKDSTLLFATIVLPPNAATPASVPLIVNPYGGPHDQSVRNAWGGSNQLFDQLLAQHGFAVLHVDNRGMGGRGRDFEQAAFRNFGPIQFEDQLTALDQVLAQFPQLNAQKLGFWGWSWGGSFTLYAMEHSDRFRTGVAVAPVTDWRNYDSIYTERYLSQPKDDFAGYKDGSTLTDATKLHGHLLLVHGTGDDNVHLANSIQIQQALIDAHIPFDLQLYPRKTHSISGYDARTHLFNRILLQFETYLK